MAEKNIENDPDRQKGPNPRKSIGSVIKELRNGTIFTGLLILLGLQFLPDDYKRKIAVVLGESSDPDSGELQKTQAAQGEKEAGELVDKELEEIFEEKIAPLERYFIDGGFPQSVFEAQNLPNGSKFMNVVSLILGDQLSKHGVYLGGGFVLTTTDGLEKLQNVLVPEQHDAEENVIRTRAEKVAKPVIVIPETKLAIVQLRTPDYPGQEVEMASERPEMGDFVYVEGLNSKDGRYFGGFFTVASEADGEGVLVDKHGTDPHFQGIEGSSVYNYENELIGIISGVKDGVVFYYPVNRDEVVGNMPAPKERAEKPERRVSAKDKRSKRALNGTSGWQSLGSMSGNRLQVPMSGSGREIKLRPGKPSKKR